MMLLSIIVPGQNVEAYIGKCLDSLLDQDISSSDYEIIVVNDGSTDGTQKIVEGYASSHSNVILINQQNKGLSGARNSGVKVARGRYVMYIDSDDYIEKNVFGGLLAQAERDNLDVLRYNYKNVNEDYKVIVPKRNNKLYVDYSGDVTDGFNFLTHRLGYACYAWQFLIKAEIAKNVLFKEGIYFEDTEWAPRMLNEAKRVASTDVVVYNYMKRTNSITNAVDESKKRKVIEDKMSLIDGLQLQSLDKSDKSWYEGMIAHIVLSILGLVTIQYYKERNDYIRRLKKLGVFPLSLYNSSVRNKTKLLLISICPLLYCRIIRGK